MHSAIQTELVRIHTGGVGGNEDFEAHRVQDFRRRLTQLYEGDDEDEDGEHIRYNEEPVTVPSKKPGMTLVQFHYDTYVYH